jgi:transposase InsO family protein
MFSLFHKDNSTLPEQEPGDQTPMGVEQSGAASFAGVRQAPSTVGVPPRLETDAMGVVPPALATETSLRTGAAGADAAGIGSADRHEMTPGVAGRSEEISEPLPAAREEAPSPGPSISWAGEEAAEFTEDDDEGSVDAEPVKEERETPVRLTGRRKGTHSSKGRELKLPEQAKRNGYTPEQRLLMLDTWRRSGLPALDFASLVGVGKDTLYKWKQQFERLGPAGLLDQPRGGREGSRLPELTKRTILMLKEQHPEWGCQRISDLLARGPALPASASAVARVLHEAGYEAVEETTHPHPDHVRRFERAQPNQLWQTDLFTFVLKRQNRRVYMVAFLDDHSRFLVSYGLHASQSTALVLEVLEAGIANYGPPDEILTDNGAQYVTWRGKSQFTRRLEQRGIRQLVARPQRPQTLGKIERFWGTLWREFLETAIFADLAEARARIGHFIDYYNFQRPHRGADGLVPADRFFQAAPTVLQTLKERVAANALELARYGQPKAPFYVTGQVAGQTFSVHAEGERLVLRRQGQGREEIELTSPGGTPPSPSSGASGEGLPAASTAGPLPVPLCPDGSPRPEAGEPACAAPPAPGQTRLDLARLAEGLRASPAPSLPEALSADNQREQGGAS